MNIQEVLVLLLVVFSAAFSLRTFLKQFFDADSSCTHCSCEPLSKKIASKSKNAIRFKKINTF